MIKVEQAAVPCLGVDTSQPLSLGHIDTLRVFDVRFVIRYVPLDGGLPKNCLTGFELEALTKAGLAVMCVQHGRSQDWTANRGLADGREAGEYAKAIDYPHDATLWCDLEASERAADPKSLIDYANAWCVGAASGSALRLGLYVGAGLPLTGPELYGLPFRSYWRSCSQVPNIPHRGYQMIQLFPPNQRLGEGPDSVQVDFDIIQTDYESDRPFWAVKGE
jgi:hypothetical protein